MIPRYSRPDMAAIWSPETKFRIWFEIEAHAADAMAELGTVPSSAMASAACASISDQMRNFVSGDQIAAISGRE